MAEPEKDDIKLRLDWNELGETAAFRRNTTGFNQVKEMAAKAGRDQPVTLNAFLYAFLCPAKNFDLFLSEQVDGIAAGVQSIGTKMEELEGFERKGKPVRCGGAQLLDLYLRTRKVAARRNARDEQRTLATLLFSGPSTPDQVADDLGIGKGLVERVLQVLKPVVEQDAQGRFAVRSDEDTLAVVLYLLRYTLGVDPMSVLQRRVAAQKELHHA